MTRFDASDPTGRQKLFADAVTAHRERGSAFLTVEAELTDAEQARADDLADEAADEADPSDAGDDTTPPQVPWVQFAEQTVNLDCTDAELDRLKNLLAAFPEFRIDQLETPEEAEGTNVRITARADANRLAGFVERVFLTVYERPDDYRAWVVQL
ncbi:hypothetical protein [Salinirubrum litoreum]|uniref:DUF7975 domain-containing protein n=1 Tax=Salinirubrum litoreum TaxID=1126234 RepID=A0ABD5RCW1_9EURY|nr:hypothetical protein [Salinirubrum litoreum]